MTTNYLKTKAEPVIKMHILLAYFQKMKVGLSNYQSVCLCMFMCVSLTVRHPLITFEPIG
jgi:hypothetical protein